MSELEELAFIKDLHSRLVPLLICFLFFFLSFLILSWEYFHPNEFCFVVIRTADELGVDASVISSEQLFLYKI